MYVSLILFIFTQKILSGHKTKFLLKKCTSFFVGKFIPVASFKIYYNWLKQCLQTHTSKSENKKRQTNKAFNAWVYNSKTRKSRLEDLCEIKTTQGCTASVKPVRIVQSETLSPTQPNNKK